MFHGRPVPSSGCIRHQNKQWKIVHYLTDAKTIVYCRCIGTWCILFNRKKRQKRIGGGGIDEGKAAAVCPWEQRSSPFRRRSPVSPLAAAAPSAPAAPLPSQPCTPITTRRQDPARMARRRPDLGRRRHQRFPPTQPDLRTPPLGHVLPVLMTSAFAGN